MKSSQLFIPSDIVDFPKMGHIQYLHTDYEKEVFRKFPHIMLKKTILQWRYFAVTFFIVWSTHEY